MLPERMTRETTELRKIVESGIDIWDFAYPSYYKGDEKKAFEQKVLDHYWMRQIGSETVGRFLHYFRRTVREIMPYYIQLYQSVDLMKDPEIRPLDNYNMIEEYNASGSSTARSNASGNTSNIGSNKTTSKGNNARAESDTPQGQLNITIVDDALNLGHASLAEQSRNSSEASENTSNTENHASQGDSSGSSTDKHTLTRRGNIGVTTYSDLLKGYRETFLNIDMQIIAELESCFLGVY